MVQSKYVLPVAVFSDEWAASFFFSDWEKKRLNAKIYYMRYKNKRHRDDAEATSSTTITTVDV